MTSLTFFLLAALALLLVVLAILLRPLLRARGTLESGAANGRRDANLRIFREQLAELEREHDEGLLAGTDFEQARLELQRRLLDEVEPAPAAGMPASRQSSGRKTALALLVLLPLAAGLGYGLLGTPQAMNPRPAETHPGGQQFEAMLGRLVARLESNPDDAKGWVMLARSYRALERYAEAANAYGRAGMLVDGDPALLADYAEVLARASGGSFDGQPDALIKRALKLDPDHPDALFLAGASARERKDFASAVTYWNRLLRQLDPASEEARSVQAAVSEARSAAGKAGGK